MNRYFEAMAYEFQSYTQISEPSVKPRVLFTDTRSAVQGLPFYDVDLMVSFIFTLFPG